MMVTVVLGADKRPALIGEIAALSIGEINLDKIQAHVIQENIPKRFCLISPVVTVSNTGTPSIAKGYRLKVIFPDGTIKSGTGISFPGELRLVHPNGINEMTDNNDLLLRKTIAQPIARGSFVQGRLNFMLPDVPLSELRRIGNTFRVEFDDLWGRKYKADFKYTEHQDVILDFDGMSAPSVSIDDPQQTMLP